jgi:hypothetical protein
MGGTEADKDRADDLKAAQLATAQAINRHSMIGERP